MKRLHFHPLNFAASVAFLAYAASVVKYVYDAVNPTQAMTLSQAVSAVPEPSVFTGILVWRPRFSCFPEMPEALIETGGDYSLS